MNTLALILISHVFVFDSEEGVWSLEALSENTQKF